jgi:hypothetical protein
VQRCACGRAAGLTDVRANVLIATLPCRLLPELRATECGLPVMIALRQASATLRSVGVDTRQKLIARQTPRCDMAETGSVTNPARSDQSRMDWYRAFFD